MTDNSWRNKAIHTACLAMTKTGDGLVDPKLILSWVLNSVGAPQSAIGLLVPLRESFAMLPQILEAAWLRTLKTRRFVRSAGSAIQAVAVAAMAAALWLLQGSTAGWAVAGLIVVFALGRSLASVSYKDVLGSTVDKGNRGSVTGIAGSIAATVVLMFGVALSFGFIPLTLPAILIAISIGAGFWLLASGLQLGSLGPFVLASSIASILGSGFWGVVSDSSSRRVIVLAALVGTVVLAVLAAVLLFDAGGPLPVIWAAVVLFVLMMAYQGVRRGRSTHIVDMAPIEACSGYVAISNTVVGLLLLGGGAFGVLADLAGLALVFAVLALMCAAGAAVAQGLEDVQSS